MGRCPVAFFPVRLIDEAFARGSDESAEYGLRLFQQLNLQLLVVTPLQKIHIIEPFVSNVGFVHNEDGGGSKLRNLTIEEYRAEKAARTAVISAIGRHPNPLRHSWNVIGIPGKLLASVAGKAERECGSAKPQVLLFPLRLPLRGPASRELSEKFNAVRSWIAQLESSAKPPNPRGYRVEMRQIQHRVLGANTVPAAIWIDSVDDALAIVGKEREGQRFRFLYERTVQQLPVLVPWVLKHPLRALELADQWPRLMEVTAWLQQHPQPGIYLRQIDLPGIDSKFIEQHKPVLNDLFDLALPEGVIDRSGSGQAGFARRYGFREKPVLIRFRILDRRETDFFGR